LLGAFRDFVPCFQNPGENQRIGISRFRERLITIDDLANFKLQLLFEINNIIKELVGQPRKWVKKHEVRKFLNINGRMIHTLRSNGTPPYKKIGNIVYYETDDIQRCWRRRRITFGEKY